jgi:hypothetical protein
MSVNNTVTFSTDTSPTPSQRTNDTSQQADQPEVKRRICGDEAPAHVVDPDQSASATTRPIDQRGESLLPMMRVRQPERAQDDVPSESIIRQLRRAASSTAGSTAFTTEV